MQRYKMMTSTISDPKEPKEKKEKRKKSGAAPMTSAADDDVGDRGSFTVHRLNDPMAATNSLKMGIASSSAILSAR